MPRESVHYIRGRALRAIASARRLELIEALMSEQPATVEELGRHLGRDPKTLYHHLRPLLKAGLVEEAGERPTSKRPATIYRLPADRLELDPQENSTLARRKFRTSSPSPDTRSLPRTGTSMTARRTSSKS